MYVQIKEGATIIVLEIVFGVRTKYILRITDPTRQAFRIFLMEHVVIIMFVWNKKQEVLYGLRFDRHLIPLVEPPTTVARL